MMDIRGGGWFLNPKHSDIYGNISYYAPRGKSAITDKAAVSSGRASMKLKNNSGTSPYQDTIHAVPRSWLLNKHKDTSLHEIDFTVKFIGASEEWSGKGGINRNGSAESKIGKVINAKPSNKTMRKIEW
jgi:hypothetical protein